MYRSFNGNQCKKTYTSKLGLSRHARTHWTPVYFEDTYYKFEIYDNNIGIIKSKIAFMMMIISRKNDCFGFLEFGLWMDTRKEYSGSYPKA